MIELLKPSPGAPVRVQITAVFNLLYCPRPPAWPLEWPSPNTDPLHHPGNRCSSAQKALEAAIAITLGAFCLAARNWAISTNEVRHSPRLNSLVATTSAAKPIDATIANSSQTGTVQPFQVTA